MIAHVAELETAIGEMVAVASDTHLLLLEFAHRRMLPTQLDRVRRAHGCSIVPGASAIHDRVRAQLDEYFRGDRFEFDVPYDAPGTPFPCREGDAPSTAAAGRRRSR